MKSKKAIPNNVTAEWLAERGGKYQKLGGAYSFFGHDGDDEPSWAESPLLWIDVHADGIVSLALVSRENKSMRYFLGQRTREQIDQLLTLLGTVPRPTPTGAAP